ncbi:MAG TPA: Gmad2 immunoglobulin-like domain-containing protein [Candidatus Paceibacterota bacterium]|nr:hypothetical protein [Patescibacteria group bacterium]
MTKYIIALVVVVGLMGASFWYLNSIKTPDIEIEEEEVVVEEENNTEEKISYVPSSASDLIKIDSPKPGQKDISSPIKITGEARGNWFFEATAPVMLTNWDGLIIAEGYITAKGEWMTEDFVPFEGEIVFDTKDIPDFNKRGSLIIKNSNASGLPERDMAAEMVIFFK